MSGHQVVLITGGQRTGTSVFRELLAKTRRYLDCGEVLARGRATMNHRHSYFTFLESAPENMRLHADFPSFETKWDLLKRFIQYLEANNPYKRILLLDVKYDYVHGFSQIPWLFTESPLLLTYCQKNQIPVLNFRRRNILDQYLSLQYGLRAGQWHYTAATASAVDAISFSVEANQCLQWLEGADLANKIASEWVKKLPLHLELIYEELYEQSHLKQEAGAALSQFLDDNSFLEETLPFVKSPLAYWEVLKNREALVAAVAKSRFRDLLPQYLR